MMALPAAKLNQLAKIAGMFGSAHDAERAAAAAHADRIVREAGVTWCDLLAPCTCAGAAGGVYGWRSDAAEAQAAGEVLTPWEAHFLARIRLRAWLTPKQHAVLATILAKVRAA